MFDLMHDLSDHFYTISESYSKLSLNVLVIHEGI